MPEKRDSLSEVIKTKKQADDFMRQLDSISGKNNKLSQQEGLNILQELINNFSDEIDSGVIKNYDGYSTTNYINETIINELIKKLTK